MDFNFPLNIQYCKEFVDSYSSLLFYSHIPPAIIGLIVGIYIFKKNKSLLSRILLAITITFAIWVALDLTIWLNYDKSSLVMFAWSNIEVFSTLLFLLCLYFIEVFCCKQDASFDRKVFFAGIFLPIAIFSSTTFYLNGFDLQECTALENSFYLQYTFYFKVALAAYILAFSSYRYFKANKEMRRQILIMFVGIIGFVLTFFVAGYISERTLNYTYEMYGLFGMPLFIGFLAYLIVKFKTFNIRLIGAQALVAALAIVSGSQYFFSQSNTSLVLNTISFVLIIVFGTFIIRSVKKEIESREKQQELTNQLQRVNSELAVTNTRLKALSEQKSEFISFATHQLRSPLTAIKGYVSMLLEGDYGKVTKGVKDVLQIIFVSTRNQTAIVEDYLNISRIELGTMKYDMIQLDFREVVQSALEELKTSFTDKNLDNKFDYDMNETFVISADPDKIKQVVMNVLDNSIKYTDSGHVHTTLTKDAATNTIKFRVSDTGVGIKEDVLPKLFQKFTRAPKASEANIHGTGLGLYIAKEIVTAHGGKIWAKSAGEGKGSQFYIELPLVK